MKKWFCLFALMITCSPAFCQDVIINGSKNNRVLTWDDFTGTPDKNSVHDANTYWSLLYSYEGFTNTAGTIKIKGLKITLELVQKFSWVKPGKETPILLKHEQGHFNIGLMCQQEMIGLLNNTVYQKNEIPGKLQDDFNSVLNKYRLMNIQYDEETSHSQNLANQEKWNDYFIKELKAR